MQAAGRWIFVVVVAMLVHASLLSGCATSQRRSPLYEAVGRGRLSLPTLRALVRDCARRFPAVLEATAIRLGEGPTTEQQRKGLTEFKANGVPMVQSVLLQHDPVAALIDGWVLLYQLRDFLVSGAIDPTGLPETVRTVEGLAEELARLWAALTGRPDVGATRAEIEAWARAHPLRGSLLARESAAPLLSSLVGQDRPSLLDAAGSAVQSLDEAIGRLDLYAISLPRQVRWQAEAAVLDLAGPLGALVGDANAVVSSERAALLAGLGGQRAAFERFARGERQALLTAVTAEREAALHQADSLARGLVDRVFERFERLVLLTAAAVVGVVLVAGLLRRPLSSATHRREREA